MIGHFLKKIEFIYHVSMLLLLTGAFLPLWREMTVGQADPLEGDPLVRGILLGGYLVGLALLVPKLRLLPSVVRRTPLLWLLVLWAGLSVLWSVEPEVSLRRWVAVVLLTLYALALALRYEFTGWLRLFLWVGVINLVGSLLVSVFLPEWGVRPEPRGEPWRGWFVQKNSLGRAAVMALLAIAFTTWLAKRPASKAGYYFLFGLALFLLYKSDSKTSWVMALLVFMSILFFGLGYRLRKAWPVYILGSLLIVSGGLLVGVEQAETVAFLLGRDLTLTGRTTLWETVWSFVMEQPWLGYGLGAFWASLSYRGYVSALEGWEVPHAHNGYLDLWLDLGLPGLLMGVSLLLWPFGVFWKKYQRTGSVTALFHLLLLSYLAIYNFAESAFLRTNNMAWFLLVSAYLRAQGFGKGCGGFFSRGTKGERVRGV